MSRNVAVISASGEVIAINVQPDDYDLAPHELEVLGAAWVGGDYVDGYFYAPRPFPSWVRNEGKWLPPVPMPDGATWETHRWDEDTLSWVKITA